MKKIDWMLRLTSHQPFTALLRCTAVGLSVAALLLVTGVSRAQDAAAEALVPGSRMSVPEGYTSRQMIDVGGHIASTTGSTAMYSTLVNQQSGPRVLSQSFDMRAAAGTKHALVDGLSLTSGGFGGDPVAFARLNVTKGKLYDFSGFFRRNRQYFDYDLLGNPNLTPGRYIPIGSSAAPTDTLAWPQVMHSPEMFNTVRRMLDTNLTIHPLSTWSYRVGYSQNVFEGPSLSPSYTIMKYDALLQQYQRNSSDEFLGAVDWKPSMKTRISFEERIVRYKADSFFTLDPNGFMVQEADGTPVYLGNWDSQTAYGIGACNTTSMGSGYTSSSNYTILSPATTTGGMPIINAACAAVTSYTRTQPTRILTPTETLRLQSSALKNVTMNGNFSYTLANSKMPSYYEDVLGLSGSVRESTYSGGYGKSHRAVISVDYGLIWQVIPTFSLAEQIDFYNVQEPGYSNIPAPATLSTPSTAGNQTINYSGTLTAGTGTLPHGIDGVLVHNFYGDKVLTNLLTGSWDVSPRVRLALSYRYKQQRVSQGMPHNIPIPFDVENDPINGYVDITSNAGIFNAAIRPAANWNINGTVELGYSDNAFTSVTPRQTQRYRLHTKYRPKNWATLTAGFSSIEHHNNTYNGQESVEEEGAIYQGPLDHVDYNRSFGVGASLAPSEHYGIDFNYGYSEVYTATNTCYTSGASATQAGTATMNADGTNAVCPGVFARGSTTVLVDWFARDFMDAPTQSGSVSLSLSPSKKIHTNLGYTISSVNGTQFFTDARAVNGSLTSTYQSPFVKLGWTLKPGLTWKAEYNFYGYGEGGASGAEYCSTATSLTATITPCADMTLVTGRNSSPAGMTAPRNFHANNVTLALHYEF
jgi:hypothetical protein